MQYVTRGFPLLQTLRPQACKALDRTFWSTNPYNYAITSSSSFFVASVVAFAKGQFNISLSQDSPYRPQMNPLFPKSNFPEFVSRLSGAFWCQFFREGGRKRVRRKTTMRQTCRVILIFHFLTRFYYTSTELDVDVHLKCTAWQRFETYCFPLLWWTFRFLTEISLLSKVLHRHWQSSSRRWQFFHLSVSCLTSFYAAKRELLES